MKDLESNLDPERYQGDEFKMIIQTKESVSIELFPCKGTITRIAVTPAQHAVEYHDVPQERESKLL